MVLSFASIRAQNLQRYEFRHRQMGTQFTIITYADKKALAEKAAAKVFARLDSLNAIFSDYIPTSELRQLTEKNQPGKWTPVSKDLWEVLTMAQKISRKSKGAFDITVGPLSVIWRRAFRRGEFPETEQIEVARSKVNYKKLRLRRGRACPQLTGMRLDAGGIAKGYAVDEMYKILSEMGLKQSLVDGGGDLYAGQAPPGKLGWSVLIKTTKEGQIAEEVIQLENQAIATSGDTYRFLEWEGQRYSHIIDPRTGLGVRSHALVSVLAPNCMLADALASALSVEPSETGLKWIRHFKHTKARIILQKEKQSIRYGF